jgi:sulfofructose kinase
MDFIDVLCVGQACYDLNFSVPYHPADDEKTVATNYLGSGGGPAANAAVAIARLGYKSAFAGYLGEDVFGSMHYQELIDAGVNCNFIVRGSSPTPVSAAFIKPDGKRALVNYKGATQALPIHAIDFSSIRAKVILFDGHEPQLSLALIDYARTNKITTVLDAGSVHSGTLALYQNVDYLVGSEKFAKQLYGDVYIALDELAKSSLNVIITLGEKGLIWKQINKSGVLSAPSVIIVDTTGAGDAFHGAFAAAVAENMEWHDILKYASVAGALCCTQLGARSGLPDQITHRALYEHYKKMHSC